MSPKLIRKIAWIKLQPFITVVFFLLVAVIVMPAQTYGTTYVQVGDTAGLPYTETRQADIFLKEAYIQLQTLSSWERQTAGFEPHHAVEMNMNARYVFQNDGDEEVDLSIKAPLMASLDESSLSIALNSHTINYSGVEYGNPREAGTGLLLYTLDLVIPPGTSVMMVNGTSTGAAGRDVDFTVLMMNDVSTWPRPIEKLVVSSMLENGIITGYSIPPSETTLKAATWEFDKVPDQDLTLRWQITGSPVVPAAVDDETVGTSDPLIPPAIILTAGGAIIGYIAYIRLKRRTQKRI